MVYIDGTYTKTLMNSTVCVLFAANDSDNFTALCIIPFFIRMAI